MEPSGTKTILWLTENYFPNTGGMAQSCDRIVQNLRDAGLYIGLVHFRNTKSAIKFKQIRNGFNLIMPASEGEGHCFNQLCNYLENPQFQFLITHIVAFGGYLPIIGAPILAKFYQVPLITMLRGNDFDLSLFAPKRRDVLFYALNNSLVVCTVASLHKQKIEKLTGHKNVQFIPNGIDVSNWQPHKSELDIAYARRLKLSEGGCRIIGVFGHLKPKKGIEFLVDSIVRSGHSEKLFLLITGEVYPQIKEKLEGAGLQYLILPFMDRFELLSVYPTCDAIAIPSFYDGLPNVLLESCALGIPVLAANTGGISDVFSKEGYPFLFHPGDEEACAQTLINFLKTNQNDLLEIGQRLKVMVTESFNKELETRRYLSIFNSMSFS
jgi:glycogen synthase